MILTIGTMRIQVPSELGRQASAIGHAAASSLSGSRIASGNQSHERLFATVALENNATNEAIGAAIAAAILNRLSEGD